ncbi:MAG: FeoB-associated Cys-rich membrane protein [Lachnospiraceae bacterium]|nr:FeoB-associated Cys-rich membrane protein [Lachnospiraceae bacterium]
MSWIIQNIGTIIVCIILVAVIAGILYNMVKNKKKGKSSCGCNCSCCPAGGVCHKHDKESIGVKPKMAAEEACLIEHVISDTTYECIRDFIKKGEE